MNAIYAGPRKGGAKLAVVENATADDVEPELPDDEGGDEYDTAFVRMECLKLAAKCFKADTGLPAPVQLARNMFKFVVEG